MRWNENTMNRMGNNHRPVLLSVLICILLTLMFLTNPGIVNAKPVNSGLNGTQIPSLAIQLPESEEPVILQPGNNARLISPLDIKIVTKPGGDGLVRIDLVGRDNRLIFRRLLNYQKYAGRTILIEQTIPFEIREDESARLSVVMEDIKNRTTFANSVELTLLGLKGRETKGENPTVPRFRIDQPEIAMDVVGKSLHFECGIKPINNTPVVVEIVANDGHTMASRLVPIIIPIDQTAFAAVEADLPFKVPEKTQVTLRVRQESNNLIKGTVLMWSRKITIRSD